MLPVGWLKHPFPMVSKASHQSDIRRVVVHFVTDAEPVSGRISTGDAENTFSGWLELIELLDRARSAPTGHGSDHFG